MKIWEIERTDMIAFECPACGCCHFIRQPAWSFNGNYEHPTITPSILVNADRNNPNTPRCHSFVKDGFIQFLDDCSHNMKGQTLELPDMDYEEEGLKEDPEPKRKFYN